MTAHVHHLILITVGQSVALHTVCELVHQDVVKVTVGVICSAQHVVLEDDGACAGHPRDVLELPAVESAGWAALSITSVCRRGKSALINVVSLPYKVIKKLRIKVESNCCTMGGLWEASYLSVMLFCLF